MSKINFPKKQEQRLIPKYLLEYSEELMQNHPDPSASWGGSGSTYTAGEGIVIENNEISVDAEDVALVKNLATVAFSGSYSDLSNKPDLSVYELKEDAFSGDYDDLTDKPDLSVYELKTDAFSGDYNDLTNKPTLFSGDYDDLTDKPDLTVYELKTDAFSGDYNDLTNKPTIPDAVSGTNDGTNWTTITIGNTTKNIPAGGGSAYTAGTGIDITNDVISIDNTVALKTDIPSNYVTTDTTQTISGNKTFTGLFYVSSSNPITIESSPGIAFKSTDRPTWNNGITTYSVATTSDIPTVGNGTITIKKNNTTVDTFTTNQAANKSINITVPTATSDLNNDSGFITGITSSDVTTALGYTPGTSNFSGDYDDLTDKPDLSIYAQSSDLAQVAITGSYNDLSNTPDLSIYAQSANLATVATTGSYNDLTNKPTIPTVNTDAAFIIKNIDLNSYTGNKLNLNTDAGYTTGSIMLTQVAYDSSTQKYYGYATIVYRPYLSRSWSAGYQLFSFNTTYWHPQVSTTIPGVISVNATSGSMSTVNFGISSAGTVTIETARSATTGINVNFVTTIPVIFDTDLRSW